MEAALGIYALLSPEVLTPTEETDSQKVSELEIEIRRHGRWTTPITAHKHALFVMDGHHRLAVAHRLQLKTLPVVLLDYSSVHVEAWRTGENITPNSIFSMARSGQKFPVKTTRHIFKVRIPTCDIVLEDLQTAP
ncbi:ParB N-terminal domain-containing protein [Agrobacterium rhizogenes]|nr:ParB N-terminal domain-containing protein [Rhizobium rhizogenes]